MSQRLTLHGLFDLFLYLYYCHGLVMKICSLCCIACIIDDQRMLNTLAHIR